MITMNISLPLAHYTDKQTAVKLAVGTVGEIIPALCELFPRLKDNLVSDSGELSPYVNCYINGKHMTTYSPETRLQSSDQIDFVTALVGG
jgi:sulfur-carrier protein